MVRIIIYKRGNYFKHKLHKEPLTKCSPKKFLLSHINFDYQYYNNHPLSMKEDLFNYLIELNDLKECDFGFYFSYKYERYPWIEDIDGDTEALHISLNTYDTFNFKLERDIRYNDDEINFNTVKNLIDDFTKLIELAKSMKSMK